MKNKTKDFFIKNLKWIILFITIIIFAAIVEDVFDQEIMTADVMGYKFISKYLISDVLTPFAIIITNLGSAITLITTTVILLIFVKDKKIGLTVSLNLIIVSILNVIFKNIVQRPRPTEYRLIDETGYSFPSGHSMISMAFYGFLIYLIYKYIENKKLKILLISILSILILLIGTSRIYLGVHYTSDVIAGFTISISYLIIYISIINKFILKEEKVQSKKLSTTEENENKNQEIN